MEKPRQHKRTQSVLTFSILDSPFSPFMNDLRFALRQLFKNPGFTVPLRSAVSEIRGESLEAIPAAMAAA